MAIYFFQNYIKNKHKLFNSLFKSTTFQCVTDLSSHSRTLGMFLTPQFSAKNVSSAPEAEGPSI